MDSDKNLKLLEFNILLFVQEYFFVLIYVLYKIQNRMSYFISIYSFQYS
jgi:hypothetical protein